MEKLTKEAEEILIERFGKDSIIALATTIDEIPYVRNVNAFYADGAFYVLTYGLSNKMKQIEANPIVALAGDWFTAHGKGINLGYFGKEENKDIEVVVDENGKNLEISPVYEHLNVAKPNPKEDKKNIIVPEIKKKK